jgi:hypothetical protein
MRRYPLGGVVVEPRYRLVSFHCFRRFGFSVFSFLYLWSACKRFSSPPCIGSAVMVLFIKRGESLFREMSMKIEVWRYRLYQFLRASGLICRIDVLTAQIQHRTFKLCTLFKYICATQMQLRASEVVHLSKLLPNFVLHFKSSNV